MPRFPFVSGICHARTRDAHAMGWTVWAETEDEPSASGPAYAEVCPEPVRHAVSVVGLDCHPVRAGVVLQYSDIASRKIAVERYFAAWLRTQKTRASGHRAHKKRSS